jgi:VCBS repeat-containing protein
MSLAANYTFVGKGNWSLDAVGGEATGGGTVSAIVPEGSKIEKAFLYSTNYSTSANNQVDISFGAATETVTGFTSLGQNNAGLIAYRADVTSLIAGYVGDGDAAQYDFTLSNITGSSVDGFVLAIVYSNSTESTRTISFLDGFSATTGDSFDFTFSEPLNIVSAGFEAQMSLGIGFSFQNGGSQQFSNITIDGRPLTSSAGGEDDGASSDGGLVTVGGIGDSSDNPNPTAPTNGPRFDDELYDLAKGNEADEGPFLTNGATGITVETNNPSTDDNIFFAGFNVTAVVSIDSDENDAPVAVGDDIDVTEDVPFIISAAQLLGNDFDPDAADTLTISAVDGSGLEGTLTDNGDGTYTYDQGGAFNELNGGDSVTTSFSYTITDGVLSSTATVNLTINGVTDGDDGGDPTCPTITRAGTIDGRAATGDVLTGPDYHNTFLFSIPENTGADRITNFQKVDILVTDAMIFDRNNDGIIKFGQNGLLDFDGPESGLDTVKVDGVKSLRYLGEACEDVHVYADASVRRKGWKEGTVDSDTLSGDAANTKRDTFLYDTALDIDLGDDVITNFGAGDRIITTSAIFDRNGDNIITFGPNDAIDLSGGTGGPADPGLPGEVGTITLFDVGGTQITSLQFDGANTVNGVTYYSYSALPTLEA